MLLDRYVDTLEVSSTSTLDRADCSHRNYRGWSSTSTPDRADCSHRNSRGWEVNLTAESIGFTNNLLYFHSLELIVGIILLPLPP